MTSVYQCNICGSLNSFETNNVVAHSDEKFADLCNDCKDNVLEFINDEHANHETANKSEPATKEEQLETAKSLLKDMGYVVYRPPPTRKRVKK